MSNNEKDRIVWKDNIEQIFCRDETLIIQSDLDISISLRVVCSFDIIFSILAVLTFQSTFTVQKTVHKSAIV